MNRAYFHNAQRLVLPILLSIATVCGARTGRCDEAKDAEIADLQRRIDELGAVVHQLQEQRNVGLMSTSVLPQPPGDAADTANFVSPAGEPSGAPANSYMPDSVRSSVPPRPTERQGIHTGGFPLAGWNQGFYLRSDDQSYELHITGQLQVDYRGFPEDVDTATSPDTFLIRRARLGMEATLLKYYEFRLLPDFAGTSISKSITDAYANVHYWDAFQVEMGKFKQPFSYEQLIQDRYTPFMERSMIDQLTPQRDEGLMVHGRKMFGDRMDYALAISNGEQNDSTIDVNNNKDFNTRMVFRPFDKSFDWLHGLQFGCSYGVGIENEAVTPSVLNTPATFEWFTYNSGVLANGVRSRVSPELEFFHGSFGFATQYFAEDQQLQASATKPLVHIQTNGFYVMGSYFLTGETRYDYTQQIEPIRPFQPSSPVATPGAWEVLWRVSRLDLDPEVYAANLATAGQSSLEATESTVGVNWYLNKWIRTQFNWEHAWFADPVKIGNEPFALHSEDALYTRFQLIF